MRALDILVRHGHGGVSNWTYYTVAGRELVPMMLAEGIGTMKRRYLYRRVRYRGLVRNRCQLWLLGMAMNLRRADQITA